MQELKKKGLKGGEDNIKKLALNPSSDKDVAEKKGYSGSMLRILEKQEEKLGPRVDFTKYFQIKAAEEKVAKAS